MRRVLLIATASLLALSPLSAARAQRHVRLVDELIVEGNRRHAAEFILQNMKTRAGDPYNPAQVQRDLQALLALPYFDKTATRVSTEMGPRGGVIVIFTVMELPIIRSVGFTGLRRVTEAEVLKALAEGPVGDLRERPFEPQLIRRAEWAIRELLARRGREGATVRAEVTVISALSVEVTFFVNEGRRRRAGAPAEENPWRIGPLPLWREPGGLRRHPKRV